VSEGLANLVCLVHLGNLVNLLNKRLAVNPSISIETSQCITMFITLSGISGNFLSGIMSVAALLPLTKLTALSSFGFICNLHHEEAAFGADIDLEVFLIKVSPSCHVRSFVSQNAGAACKTCRMGSHLACWRLAVNM
jgi:hypothetical protein